MSRRLHIAWPSLFSHFSVQIGRHIARLGNASAMMLYGEKPWNGLNRDIASLKIHSRLESRPSVNVCLPCSVQEIQLAQDCSRPRVTSVVRHIRPDHACRIAPDIWADRPTSLAVAVSHALEYRPLGVFQRPLDSRANIIHDLSRPPGRDVTRSIFENTGSRQ
jgi:hypothetical protein